MVKRLTTALLGLLSIAQAHAVSELELKANFVYRFAQFTQWPPPPRLSTRYCVADHPELLTALKRLPVEPAPQLLAVGLESDLAHCELLAVGGTERSRLQLWQQKLLNQPVLVVTDNAQAFRQLGMIKLQTSPDGVQFLVNLQRARQHQLQLSAHLLKLALEVQ